MPLHCSTEGIPDRGASEGFHEQATTLAAALEQDEHKDAARLALRGFVDKIVIPPGDELLQLIGNLGEMLTAASNGKAAVG